MEAKSKVVKTKKMMWKGKAYDIELTEEQLNDIRHEADVCKLNGWGYDIFLQCRVGNMIREDWPEVCATCSKEANPELKVGLGATMNLYSDRRAMTIVEVVSPKEIVVAHNDVECLDYYAGSYEVKPTYNKNRTCSFTLRRNGTWVEKDMPKENGCVTLTVGVQRHYIDPSF